ncbi:MAG TPA: hypothetical protein VIJ86_13200 [Acidimicrobiales bacterium]
MRVPLTWTLRLCVAVGVVTSGITYSLDVAGAATGSTFHVTRLFSGTSLHHSYVASGSTHSEALSKPDDISLSGQDFFVGFNNGVGPQGEASSDGDLDSTIVEFNHSGHVLGQWDVVGKTDGVTAYPGVGVLATVNEDAHSALYVIRTGVAAKSAVTRYAYNESLPHKGGTDAISIDGGKIFISASAPGTTGSPAPKATYPAVYSVQLVASFKTAKVTPLFYDENSATRANGASGAVKLALTDPDSNEVVPATAPRFGGDFMLTSQGDKEQIYVSAPGTTHQKLSVLSLTQSVDDTAWPTGTAGSLYSTDSSNDAVDVITGTFSSAAPVVVATPCGANGSPSTCPAPKYPANYLATINPTTGVVTQVTISGTPYTPAGGLAFVAG